MNETFSFKRFGTYFRYDIISLWRKHARTVFILGFSGVVFYVLTVLFNLLFNHIYQGPGIIGRFLIFLIAMVVLELFQARFYGFITDKKEGSSWILIPASRAEKFVSMLINTLIIIPVTFFVTFLCTDWLICLLDKTAGNSLFSGVSTILDAISWDSAGKVAMAEMGVSPIVMIGIFIISGFANYLFFLLCGLCFRRHKIFYAILILFGLSSLMSIVSALIVPIIDFEALFVDPLQAKSAIHGFVTVMNILTVLLAFGLGWGVWRRIKTIKH